MDPTQESEGLGATQRGPKVGLARNVRQATMRCDRLASRIQCEDLRSAARRDQESQQQTDHGRLARSIGTETTYDFTDFDTKIETLKSARLPVVLAEIERGDGGSAHGRDSRCV